jgi:hypothetical protein
MSRARLPRPRGAAALASLSLLALAACGGGGGSGGGVPAPPTGTNVAAVIVDAGPGGTAVNLPFVSVSVCQPGGANCQVIDHILLDTGSTGLRLVAEALPAGFTLPQAMSSAGTPLYECMTFADGYTWGSIRSADVKLADGVASGIPVHVIAAPTTDPGISQVPADCPNGGPPENNVVAFGANGVIGLNVFREDCGAACVTTAAPNGQGTYYGCTASACTGVTVPLAAQVPNPVYFFATNNNGVLIQMPAVDSAGQLSARGSLVLGIDTQSNNMLAGHTLLTVDASLGTFTTTYKGAALPVSFIDSGSNGYFFSDSSLPACTQNTGFYCPATLQQLSAVNTGRNNASSTVAFNVANADTITAAHNTWSVFPNVAGSTPLSGSFDFGLPFFYGRSVYVGFEGRSASTGSGPFVAF